MALLNPVRAQAEGILRRSNRVSAAQAGGEGRGGGNRVRQAVVSYHPRSRHLVARCCIAGSCHCAGYRTPA